MKKATMRDAPMRLESDQQAAAPTDLEELFEYSSGALLAFGPGPRTISEGGGGEGDGLGVGETMTTGAFLGDVPDGAGLSLLLPVDGGGVVGFSGVEGVSGCCCCATESHTMPVTGLLAVEAAMRMLSWSRTSVQATRS